MKPEATSPLTDWERAELMVWASAIGRAHRRRVKAARIAFIAVYGLGALFLFVIAAFPMERISTFERAVAAVGVFCCVHQLRWGYKQITHLNYVAGIAKRGLEAQSGANSNG